MSKFRNIGKLFFICSVAKVGVHSYDANPGDKSKKNITLYYLSQSPSCRSVLLTAKAIGLDFNLKPVDLNAGEHMKPEFMQMNPQHQIPTLDDNGFYLGESRAIMTYLLENYAQESTLYPAVGAVRALINSRLYFDFVLYDSFASYWYPQIFAGAPANPIAYQRMEDSMKTFNSILSRTKYAAGDTLTLADIALAVTVSSYEVSGFEISKYPKVDKWFKHCKASINGYAEINQKGADEYRRAFFANNKLIN